VTVLLCHCSCPDIDTARRIAQALVDERHAACVTLLPGVQSIYRWQGAIERADEILLSIKTTRAQFEPMAARIASLHPYELPEVLAVEVAAGLPAYLEWVIDNTGAGESSGK
jgi:periplasmic divalent cation tolerance protein